MLSYAKNFQITACFYKERLLEADSLLRFSNSKILFENSIAYRTSITFQTFDAFTATDKMTTGYKNVCSLIGKTQRANIFGRLLSWYILTVFKIPTYSVEWKFFGGITIIRIPISIIVIRHFIYWCNICEKKKEIKFIILLIYLCEKN